MMTRHRWTGRKDCLAGNAPEDWVSLRSESFYSDNGIDLRLESSASGIDPRSREVVLADGSSFPFERLLLATGAEPVRLSIPGPEAPHVRTLRSLADCRDIIERAKTARRVVVLGASFIGLEVAAALRTRQIEVHVVAPIDALLFELRHRYRRVLVLHEAWRWCGEDDLIK
jgi:NAD(P)H-nitrite reductase large subunit